MDVHHGLRVLGAGHVVVLEQPAGFTALPTGFLAGLPSWNTPPRERRRPLACRCAPDLTALLRRAWPLFGEDDEALTGPSAGHGHGAGSSRDVVGGWWREDLLAVEVLGPLPGIAPGGAWN